MIGTKRDVICFCASSKLKPFKLNGEVTACSLEQDKSDCLLTQSWSCALYYGRMCRLFLLLEKLWLCFSCATGEIKALMWKGAKPPSCVFSAFFILLSLSGADTGPNKIYQGRREWGLIVFCRYRGQYQRPAFWSPHWDSICWVKSVHFLLTGWLKDVGLQCGLKNEG